MNSYKGGDFVKFKALKSFVSAIGSYEEGETYDHDHGEHVMNNWTENGLIEPVKTRKKSVKADEDK